MKRLLIALTACAALSALADTIELKSGSVLKGTVKSVSTSEIVFETEDFGEVTIKAENIVKLEDAGVHTLQFNDYSTETKKISVEQGEILADGDKLPEDLKAIDPTAETWHGEVALAYTGTRGNSEGDSGSVEAKLNRRWENDRVKLLAGYYYSRTGTGKNDDRTTTDRWEIEGQEDHFWSSAFYTYLNLKYESDRVADLRARYRAGLGGGYQWLDGYEHEATGTWNFNQEVGVNWVKEEYDVEIEDEKKNGFAALRYAHHLTYNPKWNDQVEIFHNLEYLPEVDQFSKYLIRTDVGISTKIYLDFELLAKIELDYNSKPAAERKKEDVRYIVGLGYKW